MRGDVERLLGLAISSPEEALTGAHEVLSGGPGHHDRSLAHHAVAIVERDRGRTTTALTHARAAVAAARRAGPEREAEARATLGTTLLFAGQTAKGLAQLNRAVELTTGRALHRVLHLRGCTFWLLGRYDEAVDDLTRSVELSRQVADKLWEGRALGSRGDVRRAMGHMEKSAADYAAAEAAHLSIGEVLEATLSARNRALVALQRGDVVSALTLMDQAEERYREAGVDSVEQLVDHADALLTARLAAEAQAMLDAVLAREDLAPVWRADLLLASARAALLEEDWAAAWSRAREAESVFRTHRRSRWAARSALLADEAAFASARGTSRDPTTRPAPQGDRRLPSTQPLPSLDDLFTSVRSLTRSLRGWSDPALPECLLLLAQVAHETGHDRVSQRALAESAAARHRGAPLPRAAGWLAAAMLAEQRGNRRALRHASRRGLDAVDEHRSLIGDLELRALATGYGLELASVALDDAVRGHDARDVLRWAERWRATLFSAPSVRPADDDELLRDLAALRDVTRRLAGHEHDSPLVREQERLEAAVRRRYRRLRADRAARADLDLDRLVETLGPRVLLSIVLVRGRLHAVTIADRRATLHPLGDVRAALREAGFARFALRRAAFGRPVDVAEAGRRLQVALLGDPHPAWSRDEVVVVPSATLLAVPFGMLPVFRDSAVTIAPSAAMWHRSRVGSTASSPGAGRHVALVTGPGLSSREQEVRDLEHLHPDAVVLDGSDASVDGVLRVLDGARLAHVAAHGSFRADAPLFSWLMLADGPLMVHDLDRLARPPERVVLSACDSGGLHPIGADEALGLVSSFLAMGTRSVVASVAPVNDHATTQVMAVLHATVARGGSMAEGLLGARRHAGSDPLLLATAYAFNAWGA